MGKGFLPISFQHRHLILALSDLGRLEHSRPGAQNPPAAISLSLFEIWLLNLTQMLFITKAMTFETMVSLVMLLLLLEHYYNDYVL